MRGVLRGVAAALACALLGGPAQALQELHVGNGADPETLDPHRAQTVPAMNIARDMFEGLTRISADGSPIPAAAERWEASADGLSYTFHLRAGLRWSNGDPLVAADFAAGLRRALDPATASPYGPVLAVIANGDDVLNGRRPASELAVDAPEDHLLHIRLQRPAPYFPGLLALPAAAPLHAANGAPRESGARGPTVSNGAYRLEKWALQSQVRLVRNPHYWNDAGTTIDAVVFHPTEDRDTELKRYRAGELDITYSVPQGRATWVRESFADQLRLAPYLGTYYLGFNCTASPFADRADLRRALSLAIDREVLADKVLRGFGSSAHRWVPDGVAGYAPPANPEGGASRVQRWAEARRLYASAGYSEQRPLEFELRYTTSPDNRRLATVLAAMWKQALGANVRLVNEENRVLLGKLKRRDGVQAFLWSWIGDYNDATTFLDVFESGSAVNYSGWNDAPYQALLTQAEGSTGATRAAALQQAELRLLEEVPVAPLYFYRSRHLVKPRVTGWTDHILDYHYSQDLRLAAP